MTAEQRAERDRQRLADIFAAGYAQGLTDAAEHPLSEDRKNRYALLITPTPPAPRALRSVTS